MKSLDRKTACAAAGISLALLQLGPGCKFPLPQTILPKGYKGDYSEYYAYQAEVEARRLAKEEEEAREEAEAKAAFEAQRAAEELDAAPSVPQAADDWDDTGWSDPDRPVEPGGADEVEPETGSDDGSSSGVSGWRRAVRDEIVPVPTPLVAIPPREGEDKEYRLDEEIARDVRAALKKTPLLAERHLAVSVEGGIVVLEGEIKVASEATAAILAASKVDGVRGVYDLLELEPRPEFGLTLVVDHDYIISHEGNWEELRKLAWQDWEVQRAVETAFSRTPELDPIDVEVRIEGNVIVLSGRVSSARERRAAASLAQREGGRRVRNEIEVRPAFEIVRPPKKAPL